MQICIILLFTAMYLKDKKLHFLKVLFLGSNLEDTVMKV